MLNKNGFSLMELMIVIAIIGILAAITIPNVLGDRQVSQAQKEIREIMGFFQKAKMEATRRNKRIVIIFDEAADTYLAFVDECGNAWALDACDTRIKTKNIEGDVDLYTTLTGGTFAFNPRGLPEGLPNNFPGQTAQNQRPAIFIQANANRFFRVTITIAGGIATQTSSDGNNWQ